MALVTYDYYTNTYIGESVATADFPRFEARAEDLILGLINTTADNVVRLSTTTLTAVQKSICAQIEYFQEYGIGVASYGKEAGSGFTVGKVSVNEGSSSSGTATGARSMICPAVYVYLERTGLLNPAVNTAAEPWLFGYGWGWM